MGGRDRPSRTSSGTSSLSCSVCATLAKAAYSAVSSAGSYQARFSRRRGDRIRSRSAAGKPGPDLVGDAKAPASSRAQSCGISGPGSAVISCRASQSRAAATNRARRSGVCRAVLRSCKSRCASLGNAVVPPDFASSVIKPANVSSTVNWSNTRSLSDVVICPARPRVCRYKGSGRCSRASLRAAARRKNAWSSNHRPVSNCSPSISSRRYSLFQAEGKCAIVSSQVERGHRRGVRSFDSGGVS